MRIEEENNKMNLSNRNLTSGGIKGSSSKVKEKLL
jgi:hypothetical protein